jgi:hypothetical protein
MDVDNGRILAAVTGLPSENRVGMTMALAGKEPRDFGVTVFERDAVARPFFEPGVLRGPDCQPGRRACV